MICWRKRAAVAVTVAVFEASQALLRSDGHALLADLGGRLELIRACQDHMGLVSGSFTIFVPILALPVVLHLVDRLSAASSSESITESYILVRLL